MTTHIAEVLPNGILMQGHEDDRHPHPFDGKCKICEAPLQQLWRLIDHPSAPGWFPINCCEPCYEAAKNPTVAYSLQAWEAVCPVEFRKDWNESMSRPGLYRRVMQFNPKLKRGLLIIGASGSCKTRVAWQLMRKLTVDGVGWHFITALDLMGGMPDEARKAEVLVIDDLGNDRLTIAREIELLRVIRSRFEWHKPIVVTTQFKGDEMANRFSEGATAKAIVRRLREFCDVVNTASAATPNQ